MTDPRTEAAWLAAVMAGGAVGTAARYLVTRLARAYAAGAVEAFPWHTFGINVAGSFALGLFTVWFKNHPRQELLLVLGVGFCGGFTTFSSFSLETLTLLEKGRPASAGLYAVGSVLVGLAAAWLAVRLARGQG